MVKSENSELGVGRGLEQVSWGKKPLNQDGSIVGSQGVARHSVGM